MTNSTVIAQPSQPLPTDVRDVLEGVIRQCLNVDAQLEVIGEYAASKGTEETAIILDALNVLRPFVSSISGKIDDYMAKRKFEEPQQREGQDHE